jgi:hypothetical protein
MSGLAARSETRVCAAALLTLFLATPRVALADGAEDKSAAQALFEEAKALGQRGDWEHACPKLAESQRLDPAMGTQGALAECYEHLGKTASAWALYVEVAAAAKAAGRKDREHVAHERIAALKPILSHLTIAVDAPDTPELQVKRDGMIVGAPMWGTPVPVDPGSHTLTATAGGKKPWSGVVEVGKTADQTIRVPALSDLAAGGASEAKDRHAAPEARPARWNAVRVTAVVVGGLGVAALAVGTGMAFLARSRYDDALSFCVDRDPLRCKTNGVEGIEDARSFAGVATLVFVGGLVGVAAGAVLWLAAPTPGEPTRARLWIAPSVDSSSRGVVARGSF